jgi:hypothetical protein
MQFWSSVGPVIGREKQACARLIVGVLVPVATTDRFPPLALSLLQRRTLNPPPTTVTEREPT